MIKFAKFFLWQKHNQELAHNGISFSWRHLVVKMRNCGICARPLELDSFVWFKECWKPEERRKSAEVGQLQEDRQDLGFVRRQHLAFDQTWFRIRWPSPRWRHSASRITSAATTAAAATTTTGPYSRRLHVIWVTIHCCILISMS